MTAPKRVVPGLCGPKFDTPRDRIEQAIARGWLPERIVTELGITFEQYDAVWDAMNEAVDLVPPAKAEARAFYTRPCPEYHNANYSSI